MGYCDWGKESELLRIYHDEEWGVPTHDDQRLFEHLSLECMQCGLSWTLMLKKRDVLRECFAGFDYDRVAAFGETDVARILATKGMIRSERKVRAIINNAQAYQRVREEFGTFDAYLWGYTDGKTILYEGHDTGYVPAQNGLSRRIAADLRRRGFKYVGPVTIYSHLQACGLICDHSADCPCRERIIAAHPTVSLPRDDES
jgi:DNA-3-methyladenine glycosylase I